ncbi:hypothetical protein GCM10009804_37150 [Kribbella hippodromi]|uniref:Uncharacterized protein n=1 Tax=Kribbella hippodromi TaxID=434347 RepID=A0ABP4PAV2_9ACTN
MGLRGIGRASLHGDDRWERRITFGAAGVGAAGFGGCDRDRGAWGWGDGGVGRGCVGQALRRWVGGGDELGRIGFQQFEWLKCFRELRWLE